MSKLDILSNFFKKGRKKEKFYIPLKNKIKLKKFIKKKKKKKNRMSVALGCAENDTF